MNANYEEIGRDEKSIEKIVLEHAELVKRIAHHVLSRMPSNIEVDDLIQAGMMGLLSAAEKFSEGKGANFETYAGIRIRGAMLDEARKTNWAPRSIFKNSKRIAGAIQSIENQTGRDAHASEIAENLGISADEYHRMLERSLGSKLLSFEQLLHDPERSARLPGSSESEPYDSVEADQFRASLAIAIEGLPEREKLVLALYYQEELNLREIGEVLEVSESRVCQIHSQAVLRLRARLRRWQDED